MTEEQRQADLIKLQDAIYIDKVRRARTLTPEERLADVFELTNGVLERMLDGVMWQKKIDDIDEAKLVLSHQIQRLRLVRDYERPKLTGLHS
jgi:hypothetical protein